MSTAAVTVRYDGPILADHRMDVADLAPALLGLSELCKIANRKFNGDKASVKVLIGADVDHRCFQVDLQVMQTIWDTTKSILGNDNISSAKVLLEWLGLVGIVPLGGGLLQVLKLLKGQKITSATTMVSKEGRDEVVITINGDNNNVLIVPPQTIALLRDSDVITNAKKVVQPVTQAGYDSVEFESGGRTLEKIYKDDALAIARIDPKNIESTEIDEPQRIIAWVTVYSPVYDSKAKNWRFKFGESHPYMDISETDIVHSALKRGGTMAEDQYKVELEITQEHTPNGIANHYKITKVLDFRPARPPFQSDAFGER